MVDSTIYGKTIYNLYKTDKNTTILTENETAKHDVSSLNFLPAAIVSGVSALLTLLACSYFLSEYVVDIIRGETVFIVGSYVIFSSYYVLHYYLNIHSKSYRGVSEDKKFYVISNLIKSAVLAAITPFALILLYEIVVFNQWQTNKIRNIGCIYAIPDFVSLLLVRRMSKATIAHHICVCIFNILSMRNEYEHENICRPIVVYAIFSTLAFTVNLLLASRFLNIGPSLFFHLSMFSLIIYLFACAINWSWQIFYIRHLIQVQNHWSIYVYCIFLAVIVYDDLVLHRWLFRNVQCQKHLNDSK